MIIFTQDKETIFNFNHAHTISVIGNNVVGYTTINSIILGEYTNKTKAKEVLKDIVCAYESCFVFNMP